MLLQKKYFPMDGPQDYHTERNKSDREKQMLYDIADMWNPKKRYKWTYPPDRVTNVENKLMVTKVASRVEGIN